MNAKRTAKHPRKGGHHVQIEARPAGNPCPFLPRSLRHPIFADPLLDHTAFKSLTPGTTTKAEARKLIGAPLTETHFGRLNEDVWEYRYLEGTTIVMLAHVHFDHNGTYTYSFHMLDPAFRGGRGK